MTDLYNVTVKMSTCDTLPVSASNELEAIDKVKGFLREQYPQFVVHINRVEKKK